MKRAAVALLCLGAAACPPPADVTPLIHVDPRAARRLDWLSRPVQVASPRAARVHVLEAGEELGGPSAIGRPGDLLLENDEVAFVVDQLGSSAGFAESGGDLVDAADARERRDELGEIFTYFGTFPRQGVYDSLRSGVERDGSAWVEAAGHELYEPRLVVRTRYTLQAPDRALLLETTLDNEGDAPVELPSLGDAVQWGGAEKVAPGKPRGFHGASSGPYLGGVGRFTSYALTSTDGAIEATSGGSWSDTAQRHGVRLAPHESTRYARVFLVGARPDTASLVGELALAAGQPVGTLRVRTGAVQTGGLLWVTAGGGTEPLTLAPPYEAVLPAGTWAVSLPAGAPTPPLDVRPGGEASASLDVSAPAAVEVQCLDASGAAMPCKVTFQGQGGTPDPDFGPASAAGPARSQVTTADGVARVELLAGAYRVTASRGPEYALAAADVSLAHGDRKALALSPKRVVDTRGYLGCDFHQHTMLGTDGPTSMRDRVISNAAEGLDVAVASEHNVVADLSPFVKELRLEGSLVQIAGDELTTDASRHPWGHANVWPMAADPARARGGAPAVRDRSPLEILGELRRAAGGDFVFQVNHPRTGLTGYFDQLGFDPARGVGTDPGYDASFDALEVWNGRNTGPRQRVIDDWRALLRTGHAVTPTADTDTHGVVGQEPGYPRTYVRVSDDTRLEAWDAARTADLVRGVKTLRDVVLTNGPLLRVTAGGAPIGGLVRGPRVAVKVHVECAPWITVDHVTLAWASDAPAVTRAVTLAPTSAGALASDVTFEAAARADDALYVVASGSRPLTPVLAGEASGILPWAMSGAIWVDADGDGKALGR